MLVNSYSVMHLGTVIYKMIPDVDTMKGRSYTCTAYYIKKEFIKTETYKI